MATVGLGLPAARQGEHRFYLGMAIAFVVIAFGGFLPTYWMRIAAGTFHRPPIIHLHGLIFFAWTAYYLAQTWLVYSGRTMHHRSWGLAGIALFSVMICTVLAGQIAILNLNDTLGYGEQARRFAAVSLLQVPLLVGLFAGAIVNIRQTDVHKRLMLLLMCTLMQPAIARVFVTVLAPAGAAGPPPPFVSVPPGIVVDLLIVLALVRDWRVRGRPHPVYAIGLPLVLVQQIAVVPIAQTAGWMAFASRFQGLLG